MIKLKKKVLIIHHATLALETKSRKDMGSLTCLRAYLNKIQENLVLILHLSMVLNQR